MQISNEEMEVLNRASEILSKYAAQGGLAREDFDHYEDMVVAIIDGHKPLKANADKHGAQATIPLFSTPTAQESGEYSEKLPTGGELVVTPKEWSIQYYSLGTDLKYEDDFVGIPGAEVDSYIDAWRINLSKYSEAKKASKPGEIISFLGEKGMTIIVGGDSDGVSFHSFHVGLSTEDEVTRVINDYIYAKSRANQLLSEEKENDELYSCGEKTITVIDSIYSTKISNSSPDERNMELARIHCIVKEYAYKKAMEAIAEKEVQISSKRVPVTPVFAEPRKLELKGVYSEKLSTGGDLKIKAGSWSIQYYFPGPDMRYKGTFVSIRGKDIDQYINAWKNNLDKYYELKQTAEPGKQVQIIGEMGMTIGVGGYLDGVYLSSYHMRAKDRDDIDSIINDYIYAQTRAEQIMEALGA